MRARALVLLLALLAGGLAAPSAAWALYRWVDENGDVHITLQLEDVPERYRTSVQPITSPGSPASGGCVSRPRDPQGGATVPFSRDRTHILVDACLNGRGPVRLIVDTGAHSTMVSPKLLEQYGVKLKDAPEVAVAGVAGVGTAKRIMVRSIQVGGARLGPMYVLALEFGAPGTHGLLGQDFLDKFRMDVDNQTGTLTLTPR